VIYLATTPGQNAKLNHAQYQMDIEFIKTTDAILGSNYGLIYLGDWHSHHRLGLYCPSHGDQERIRNLCNRNGIPLMVEIIVSHASNKKNDLEHICSFIYENGIMHSCGIELLKADISPIRQSLDCCEKGQNVLKNTNTDFSLDNIVVNSLDGTSCNILTKDNFTNNNQVENVKKIHDDSEQKLKDTE
jgi:hypothetical protein